MAHTPHEHPDIRRIVHRDFPDRVSEVLALLNEYSTETWQREHDRVRLAVLKLADGELDQLRHALDAAKLDYRDVLMWAEYPEQSKLMPGEKVAAKDRKRAVEADRKQYVKWFERE